MLVRPHRPQPRTPVNADEPLTPFNLAHCHICPLAVLVLRIRHAQRDHAEESAHAALIHV